jgi:MoaA/NifB/PqqE/SkfB family radical SAM enzyme
MTCWNPFQEFRANVSVYTTCCPAWLTPAGVIGKWDAFTPELDLGPWEIWNHPIYQGLRQAILNGDFKTYCAPCSKIIAGHLEGTIEPWMKPVMELPPKRIWLEHDRHCQLACPSCRSKVDGHLPYQDKRDQKIYEICREFLPTATELTLMSSGDPLMSRSSLEILSWAGEYPQLDIELFTNGLLIPVKWGTLQNIKRLNISIDACCKETYEKVRWPGKWEQVTKALEFVKKLREDNIVYRVQLNFVVQAANYKDIPGFIRMTRDYGFDVAHMARIIQVWHTNEMYNSMNICDSRHPEHKQFLDIMQCDEFEDPITLYPTIGEFRYGKSKY